ncbi:uncharacterized protein LOC127248450 [Andrographis paniculata]|uniref:uncharacterized protein LOC127248450 n=1 Tax=Andrographis paniculata TaxID=175694 RepID=UPI0021E7A850|nr:uncharacterized protein LOC127248450 [Andrographis paniculata]
MDSGNSGSFQSSSGGDDEYDSRAVADSVSAFITGSQIPIPPPLFFDSNYAHAHFQYQQNPNTALPRPALPRSDPNSYTHPHIANPILVSASPSFQASPPAVADRSSSGLPPSPQQNQPRNPRKRSRASRRAPTTVLTTDTTNFRAMVQEFTGVPSPPFSSPFPRSRLDLFGTSVNGGGVQPPPYLRRPFAQKIQPPALPLPFLDSTAAAAAVEASIPEASSSSFTVNNNNGSINSVSSSTDSVTFQLPITAPFDLNQNSLFTSLLKTNPKFPFSNSPLISPKSLPISSQIIPSTDDQFQLLHGNQVSSSLNTFFPPDDQIPNSIPNHDKSPLPPDNAADFDFARMTDFSPGSSTATLLRPGKAPENSPAAATGEGMVESWICSSE